MTNHPLDDLDDEIRDHLEREVEEHVARGLPLSEARRQARVKFGNVALTREDTRALWAWVALEQLWQDLQFAVRHLKRESSFAITVVLVLGLGIGMTTAVFSVYHAVLLRPLPYPDPERMYYLSLNGGMPTGPVPSTEFAVWREQATSFEQMVAYDNSLDQTLATVDGAIQTRVAWVSSDFWLFVAARPSLGSAPGPNDASGIVLSSSFFTQHFDGDARAIGRAITLDGNQMRIAGVLPPDFHLRLPRDSYAPGGGTLPQRDPDVYRPYVFSAQSRSRGFTSIRVVAKLKPGVTVTEARAELETIRGRLAQSDPLPVIDRATLQIAPLTETLVGGVGRALNLLLAAVGLVLVIVCANLANLLLVRSSARHGEMSVRASLGASPTRLLRQVLTESTLLAVVGGTVGVGLAYGAVAAIARWIPHAVPRLTEASVDGPVLAFALGTSLLTAFACGAGPALALWRIDARSGFKDVSMRTSPGPRALHARRVLIVIELGLAVVLLIGAGLMVRSLGRLYAHPEGFDPERIIALSIRLTGANYRSLTAQQQYIDEALARLQGAPGIETAAIATNGGTIMNIIPEGTLPPSQPGVFTRPAILDAASEGFARAVGMRLVAGRWFTDAEPAPVLVVSEALVRTEFGGVNPVGVRLRLPGPRNAPATFATVVGVVRDLKYARLDAEPEPRAYVPYRHYRTLFGFGMFVRVAGRPSASIPLIRSALHELDPTQGVFDVQTIEDILSDSISPHRLNLVLLGTFAASALIVAMIGVYGVAAYSTAQRTREIGIRVALGATPHAVVRLLVQNGLLPLLAGTGLGLAAALGLTRLMTSLLYDVEPTDPLTFASVACLLVGTGLFASWLPARRASKMNPLIALRTE